MIPDAVSKNLSDATHYFRLPAAWQHSHPFNVLPVDHWLPPHPRPQVNGVNAPLAVAR